MTKKRSIIAEALAMYGEANRRKVRNKLIIATKISRRLRELKLSQKDFAEKIGKPASEISEILSGDRNLTIDTMTDIEQALGMRLLDTTLWDVCAMEKECVLNVPISKKSTMYNYSNASVTIDTDCVGEYAECV